MGKSIYVIAIIATAAIFLVVLLSLKSMEDQRFYKFNEQVKNITFENELNNAYQSFYDTNDYCLLVDGQLALNSTKLSRLNEELMSYKDSFSQADYISAKRNFLITNMLLFQITKKAIVDCNVNIKPVLYFYAEDKSCEAECGAMSNQLNTIKAKCPQVRVFAFPYHWPDFDFTSILEKKYDINKAGSLVINNQKIGSLISIEVLSQKLDCN